LIHGVKSPFKIELRIHFIISLWIVVMEMVRVSKSGGIEYMLHVRHLLSRVFKHLKHWNCGISHTELNLLCINYIVLTCSFLILAGYFWKTSPLEVDHVHIFLLINARVDVWTVSAILFQGLWKTNRLQ